MKRLLILSCSQRKKTNAGSMPAVERYDGPAFRLVRRFLRQTDDKPMMLILSAKYGLIRCEQPVPYYDQRMTQHIARHLRPQIEESLRDILASSPGKSETAELFLCMGKVYLEALEQVIPFHISVKHAHGSPGNKLAALHDWLYARHPIPVGDSVEAHARRVVQLRGRSFELPRQKVFEAVRQALAHQNFKQASHQAWYVEVEGYRVSPKWLVSLLTGLPVSAFHSDEARRVLRQIGIAVHRERYQ